MFCHDDNLFHNEEPAFISFSIYKVQIIGSREMNTFENDK